eukprot:gene12558-3253_t
MIRPDNQHAGIKYFYSKFPAKKGSHLKPTGESQKRKSKLNNVILDGGWDDDDEDDGSFFKNFLKLKGFSFEKDEIRFKSEEDQVVFQKDFQISLKSHKNYPQVVDLFVDGFESFIIENNREILQQNSQLTASVIEAFTSLNLAGSLLTEVRQSVLDILDSANMEDCPACVRFILQSIGDEDCVQVIGALRSRLVFEEENLYNAPGFCSTAREKQQECRDNESLILDFIKLAIRFQKSVASGWLKVIESVNDPAQSKIVDLYVLVVIHGISIKKKSVESLLRQKLKSNALSKALVTKAFTSHSQVSISLIENTNTKI